MDLTNLRCFVAAATSTSFGAAARVVALAPTSLSGRLKALEESLGVDLFAKQGRKRRLTPDGERLLPVAQRILRDVDALPALVAAAPTQAPYALTIGTRFELGVSWLVPLLDALEDEAPERLLHLAFGNTPDLMRRLGDDVDAVVTSARVAGERLASVPLHEERYAFVASPRLLKGTPLRRAGDASAHTLFDADSSLPLTRYFLDVSPAGEVWSFRRVQHLSSIAAIHARVRAGRGVAVLPRYLVEADLRARRLAVVLPRRVLARDRFRLLWRAGHPREDALRALAARLAAASLR